MLSPKEFIIGTFGSAVPPSLILPRTKHEQTVLIGCIEGAPAAVFLSGIHIFQFFPSAGNHHWKGLIIPDIRIEVDETSLFDPDSDGTPLGCAIRSDSRLSIQGRAERSFGRSTLVTLHDDLPRAEDARAAFSKWQVVIGEAPDKRVLFRMDLTETEVP